MGYKRGCEGLCAAVGLEGGGEVLGKSSLTMHAAYKMGIKTYYSPCCMTRKVEFVGEKAREEIYHVMSSKAAAPCFSGKELGGGHGDNMATGLLVFCYIFT